MATIVCEKCGGDRSAPHSFRLAFERLCPRCREREAVALILRRRDQAKGWRSLAASLPPSPSFELPALPLPSFDTSLHLPGEPEPEPRLEGPRGHPYRAASTRVDAGLRPSKSPPLPTIGRELEALRRGEPPLVRSWWDMLRELVLLG